MASEHGQWGEVLERVLKGQPKAMCELLLDRSDVYHTHTAPAPNYGTGNGMEPLQILGILALVTFLLNSVLNLLTNLGGLVGLTNNNVVRVRNIRGNLEANEDDLQLERFVLKSI